MLRAVLVGCLVVFAAACSKSPDADAPSGSSSASTTPPPSALVASASAAHTGSSPAAVASVAAVPSTWQGNYKSAASAINVPPAWKKVHWSDPESSAGIGEGTLALAIDPATGRVTGTLEGPLGPASIDGLLADGKIRATVVRKDPTDHGFSGTLLGAVASDAIEGTMNLSSGQAGALRSASFTLAPGAPVAPASGQ